MWSQVWLREKDACTKLALNLPLPAFKEESIPFDAGSGLSPSLKQEVGEMGAEQVMLLIGQRNHQWWRNVGKPPTVLAAMGRQ